jgi:hypothetical protein
MESVVAAVAERVKGSKFEHYTAASWHRSQTPDVNSQCICVPLFPLSRQPVSAAFRIEGHAHHLEQQRAAWCRTTAGILQTAENRGDQRELTGFHARLRIFWKIRWAFHLGLHEPIGHGRGYAESQ